MSALLLAPGFTRADWIRSRKCVLCGRRIGNEPHLVASYDGDGVEKTLVHSRCNDVLFQAQLQASIKLARPPEAVE